LIDTEFIFQLEFSVGGIKSINHKRTFTQAFFGPEHLYLISLLKRPCHSAGRWMFQNINTDIGSKYQISPYP